MAHHQCHKCYVANGHKCMRARQRGTCYWAEMQCRAEHDRDVALERARNVNSRPSSGKSSRPSSAAAEGVRPPSKIKRRDTATDLERYRRAIAFNEEMLQSSANLLDARESRADLALGIEETPRSFVSYMSSDEDLGPISLEASFHRP